MHERATNPYSANMAECRRSLLKRERTTEAMSVRQCCGNLGGTAQKIGSHGNEFLSDFRYEGSQFFEIIKFNVYVLLLI